MQYLLGRAYENGKGVPLYIPKAHIWYNIAASSDSLCREIYLEELEYRMTQSQIEEATRLARECVREVV